MLFSHQTHLDKCAQILAKLKAPHKNIDKCFIRNQAYPLICSSMGTGD